MPRASRFGSHLSSRLLIDLHAITGAWVADHTETLDPDGTAIFAVSWAGEGDVDELDGHRPRIHRALASPDADSRRDRPSAAAARTALDAAAARHLGARVAARLPIGDGAGRHLDRRCASPATRAPRGRLVRNDTGWAGVVRCSPERATTTVECDANAVWRLLYNAPFDRSRCALRETQRLPRLSSPRDRSSSTLLPLGDLQLTKLATISGPDDAGFTALSMWRILPSGSI